MNNNNYLFIIYLELGFVLKFMNRIKLFMDFFYIWNLG